MAMTVPSKSPCDAARRIAAALRVRPSLAARLELSGSSSRQRTLQFHRARSRVLMPTCPRSKTLMDNLDTAAGYGIPGAAGPFFLIMPAVLLDSCLQRQLSCAQLPCGLITCGRLHWGQSTCGHTPRRQR